MWWKSTQLYTYNVWSCQCIITTNKIYENQHNKNKQILQDGIKSKLVIKHTEMFAVL